MKHMISQIRPGSTNESLFWHNHKKMYYFDSFVLQNLSFNVDLCVLVMVYVCRSEH